MGLSNGYKDRWNALHFVRTLFTLFLVPCLFSLTPVSREYPRRYAGIGGIERYSQSPIINGNNTVGCVIATTSVTRAFLLREYISNGVEMVNRDIDKNCSRSGVSPPQMLVRVSSLTTTMTNYVDRPETTSAADKAAPSSLPSLPTASRTISSRLNNLPSRVANPTPGNNANPPSINASYEPAEPTLQHPTDSVLSAVPLLATETPLAEPSQEQKRPALFVDADVSPSISRPAPVKSSFEPEPPRSKHFVVSGLTFNSVVSSPGHTPFSLQDFVSEMAPTSSTFAIAGVTITQGGSSITLSGTKLSLGASEILPGSKTLKLPSSVLTGYAQSFASKPFGFSVAGTFITP